jgi:hypothetical protein
MDIENGCLISRVKWVHGASINFFIAGVERQT